MKKRRFFAIVAVLTVCVFKITACSETPSPIKTSYPIEITNDGWGTASAVVDGKSVGRATRGETVTITAVPADVAYKFIEWRAVRGGVELTDAKVNPLTIEMPGAPVEIAAIFGLKEAHSIGLNYIEHGDVDISVAGVERTFAREGEVVTITAKPYPHSTFYRWDINVELEDSEAPKAIFVMPGTDVSIGAEFGAEYLDLIRHFPDKNFRKIAARYDKDGDTRISPAERMVMAGINHLHVSGRDYTTGEYKPESELISDLSGIEYFTSLNYLSCAYNKLPSLDVSANTELWLLICDGNPLTSLDVSACSGLVRLYCRDTDLTSLDVSKNLNMNLLWCGTKNSVSTRPLAVTVRPDAKLQRLIVDGNEIAVYVYHEGEDVMISEFGPVGAVNGVQVERAVINI